MARCPEEAGAAAADSLDTIHTAVEAGAAGKRGQLSKRAELAAAAARPAQALCRVEQGKCLLTGTGQPRHGRHVPGRGLAEQKTAARVIASVFGYDSSSSNSSIHEPDHHDVPEELDPPASLPDGCKAPSKPSKPMKQEVQAFKRHNTRFAGSRGEVDFHEASLVHKAKRKAAIAEQAADHARIAESKRTCAAASKAAERTEVAPIPARCSRSSTGNAVVIAANMHSHRDTRSSAKAKMDQSGAHAVDWKAYADALDAKMAEAEALLAHDSE